MSKDFVNHVINPVTALAYVSFKSRLLLLAGEGPYFKVFDHETTRLVAVTRAFTSQAVHGITATSASTHGNGVTVLELLIWGHRRLRLAQLRDDATAGKPEIVVHLKEAIQANDWILDVRFRPSDSDIPQEVDVVLVTAQNAASLLYTAARSHYPTLKPVTAGPKSMLYSASIEWTEDGRIFVASGTVFGEVLFWSFSQTALDAGATSSASAQLHCRLTGHEGSVFGVRISPKLSHLTFGFGKRLLASCSDDRTIRVWDVSDVEINEPSSDESLEHSEPSIKPIGDDTDQISVERCVATVMGHASRIWDVRFLVSDERLDIISFGEDGTAQTWQLVHKDLGEGLPSKRLDCLHLVHREAYAYHMGKNLWASAHFRNGDGTHSISTGGADGRIVCYNIRLEDYLSTGQLPTSRWKTEDVAAQLEKNKTFTSASSARLQSHRLFNALHGAWKITRTIKSALPSYPSGNFKGKATFERRKPSAEGYHDEYLYSESGTFSADQGLTFQASRQYVYRYQASSDAISAWFVKPDDRSTVDYLFHELRMEDSRETDDRQASQDQLVVRASAYHLCVDDHYSPDYIFQLKNGILDDWSLTYHVKGPQKDFIAEACYTKSFNHGDSKEELETTSALPQSKNHDDSQPGDWEFRNDDFKTYVLLQNKLFLVTTAHGRVLLGSLATPAGNQVEVHKFNQRPSVTWELIDQFEALKSSSIISKLIDSESAFLSGNNGTVFAYDIPKKQISPIFDLGRKAAYLYAQSIHDRKPARESDFQAHLVLATSLGRPVAYIYKFRSSMVDDLRQPFLLALPASFVVTSASYIEAFGVWILGSRNGALAFYDGSLISTERMTEPCSILLGIHGEDAITVIRCLREPKLDQPAYILTTGRDGYYGLHTLSTAGNQLRVQFGTMHRSMPPLGPNIEGASIVEKSDQKSSNLILWGFRSTHFVVWNASTLQERMVVDCGGAHRNWSYCPDEDGNIDGGTFVWTKASVCNVYSQTSASHQVFQPGGHGREIKALAVSPAVQDSDGSPKRYIATGAEDTTIRIWLFHHKHEPEAGFKCLGTWTKHTTGIQQLHWSDDGRLLFSAAGCEEFFAWRVQPVPCIGIGAVCEAVCPKIFHYTSHPTTSHFSLLHTTNYGTNCLNQILHLHTTLDGFPHIYLCTASSDGHVTFWPGDSIFNTPSSPNAGNKALLTSFHRHCIHQNTVKCISTITTSSAQNELVLISGGDDGALGITRLTFHTGGISPTCSTLLYPKAHAAAINAVAALQTARGSPDVHTFATSGNDQRVKTWSLEIFSNEPGTKGLRLQKRRDRPTSVGDVAALVTMSTGRNGDEEMGVLVAGIGMEYLPASEQRIDSIIEETLPGGVL
ncbi:MAG: hypothetical protein LQ344_000325 [Seirophora lacunosa]|nr:MAG: hypothetical protein LQ344_000325 [Seirophora lacunosa]